MFKMTLLIIAFVKIASIVISLLEKLISPISLFRKLNLGRLFAKRRVPIIIVYDGPECRHIKLRQSTLLSCTRFSGFYWNFRWKHGRSDQIEGAQRARHEHRALRDQRQRVN